MFDTLADWIYNHKQYYKFHWDEFIGMLVTSIFAGFILTFNDWGGEAFDVGAGVSSLIAMSIFLFIVFFVTTAICKLVALRLKHMLSYQPHLLGLMAGLVICVASAGYLPIFLPGGFKYELNQRLYVGYWRGYHRPAAISAVTGMFPLLLLLYVVILNPIYLATGSSMILKFVGGLCLTAIFSLIPLPNVALEYGGRVLDFFRYLKGLTFGLEVYMNARTWYMPLATFTLLFSILSWIVTFTGTAVAWWIWVICIVLALLALFFYKNFYEASRLAGAFK